MVVPGHCENIEVAVYSQEPLPPELELQTRETSPTMMSSPPRPRKMRKLAGDRWRVVPGHCENREIAGYPQETGIPEPELQTRETSPTMMSSPPRKTRK